MNLQRAHMEKQGTTLGLQSWHWSIIVIVSAAVTQALVWYDIGGPLRTVFTLWFLLICPGMALILLFRLEHQHHRLVLAIALSLALELLLATLFVYGDIWSPQRIVTILFIITTGAGLASLFLAAMAGIYDL